MARRVATTNAWGSCASVRKYTSLSLFYNGLQFQIRIRLDSHNESPLGESLTNPDRNLIVSWDPTTTFLHRHMSGICFIGGTKF